MLTIYSHTITATALHTLDTIEPGCWVNLIDPLAAEINRVSEELGIPIDYLTYPLDVDERARVEKDEGVTLITALTIILAVPMLVASIYGMNVDLPFDEMQHTFWIVMGIALGTAGIAVYIFWKRDWL